jgi:hypothetical protein
MRKERLLKVAMGLCLLICQTARAQQSDDALGKVLNFPSRYINNVQQKYAYLDEQLTKQTEKYLHRLAKQEKKLKRRLSKVDSATAQQLFANSDQQYDRLINSIKNKTSGNIKGAAGEYLPYVDSISTSLSFLQQNSQVLANVNNLQSKLGGSLNEVNQLKSRMQQTGQVKAFIQQRKQQIKDALSKYSKLPPGITGSLNDFNKQAYYYSQQVKEYKDMLNDPDRMIQKGLSLLNKLPAFTKFMQQHSELASLFRLPDNYGTPQGLAGLQTRAQVQQQIQTQLASAGPNAQQYLQQNLQTAQAQLSQLKDKINKLGGNSGDIDMPNYKPNEQKTKTFWKRLEYGTNFQTARSNYFFPTTTDLGLSVGYKLNNNSTIGIGASYKMGWGKDIRHIAVTHEGMGIRSFADVKLKGSFYASGGFEYNYQPLAVTDSSSASAGSHLSDISAWRQSGLIGLSKIVSLKSKVFKKTKLQLLWDFMSYRQVPRTQPVKFRVCYNF